MFAGIKGIVAKIVHRAYPFGIDRQQREWDKKVWPKIVEAGPPADLTEKESKRAYWDLVAQVS